MPLEPAASSQNGGAWPTLAALAAADGSIRHLMCRRLAQPDAPSRDITDAIHGLGMLHGRHPGILDHALLRNSHPAWAEWLNAAVAGFARERALLARLASAAGPLPSTPGQAESEATITAQRHALDMLAQSDRKGCGMGAAIGLVLDWPAIRHILEAAAHRLGLQVQACTLPTEQDSAAIVAMSSEGLPAERALAFGVQQVLAQHRGLWDLLDARASARSNA